MSRILKFKKKIFKDKFIIIDSSNHKQVQKISMDFLLKFSSHFSSLKIETQIYNYVDVSIRDYI